MSPRSRRPKSLQPRSLLAEEPAAEEPQDEAVATPAKVSPLDPEPLVAGPLGDGDIGAYATAKGIYPTYVDPWEDHSCSYDTFKLENATLTNGVHNVPGGGTIEIKNLTSNHFDFVATGLVIRHVQVKAGTGEFVYNYDSLNPQGTDSDQGLYSVYKEIETSCDYRDISHIEFCYTRPTPSQAHIIITKYQDDDRDGWRDGSEDWLDGFQFVLEKYDPITKAVTPLVDPLTGTAPMIRWSDKNNGGQADFGMWPFGWYQISEVLTSGQIAAGWFCTDAEGYVRQFNHVREANGQEEDQTKWFGNSQLEKFTKTFELVYDGEVPASTTFHVHYKVDGVEHYLDLAGTSSPFTASEKLFEGVKITDVRWDAVWTPGAGSPVHIPLGTSDDDPCLTKDLKNTFTYKGEIDGHKYEDKNADGHKDTGDLGLEGWKIYLERKVGTAWVPYPTFAVTNASGYYSIKGILPGSYRVHEDIAAQTPPDWTCSNPASGYYTTTLDAGGASEVTIACHHKRTLDFLNWAPATIRGMKYEDLNGDGIHDSNEPGLEGWRVFVDYNGDGVLNLAPGTLPYGPEPYDDTDALGNYEITGVHPGTFWVLEEMLPGWFQSDPGADNFGHLVTFESSEVYEKDLESDYDFGNWTYATKSGMKFEDMNANGVYDAGDKPLGGIRVYVEIDGIAGFTAGDLFDITDGSDGSYFIGNVPLGTYNVYEDIAGTDWIQSFPAEGHYEVNFTSSLEDTGNDFGNWMPASIEGTKSNDVEANGVFDDGDYGMSGWTIYVDYNDNGEFDTDPTTLPYGPEPSDVTDVNGHYEIDDVHPGAFTVREVDQAGWTQSRGDFDVTFESRGHYGAEGEYHFLNWTTTDLHGYKFEDMNADGVKDPGEVTPGIAFTIALTGTDYMGGSVYATTTTDPSNNGYYEFTDIVPGTYVVSEMVPTGWTQSFPAASFYDVTIPTLVGAAAEMSYDFGNWRYATKSGMKFEDMNANGVYDAGDKPLGGIRMFVESWETAYTRRRPFDITEADGSYFIDNVPLGTYNVYEDIAGTDWIQSFPDDPNYYEVDFTSSLEDTGNDFGNWMPASIEGTKSNDLEANGVFDDGDYGMSGWTIYVDYNDNGEFDTDPSTLPYGSEPSDVTDVNGHYEIDDVHPGAFTVREVDQAGWTQSRGDFDVTFESRGHYGSEGESHFLNWTTTDLHGYKFEDMDADGVKDPGEVTPGIAFTIALTGTDYMGGSVYATTTTDPGNNGYYEFTDLVPGTYVVSEMVPADWTQSFPASSFYDVTIPTIGAASEMSYDFGNWTHATKAGMKFEDMNANGIYDAGDKPLGGIRMFVDVVVNGVYDTGEPYGITALNGSYFIDNVPPGTYKVYEDIAGTDWIQSFPTEGYYEVNFTSSLEDTGNDFGNWMPASIEGTKSNDLEANGVFDDGDYGMSGWTIYVDYNDNGEFDTDPTTLPYGPEPSDVTDVNGHYEIDDVHPGAFTVREVDQAGWTQSRGDFDVTFESQGHYGDEGEYHFLNWTTTDLHGYKFEDMDADGVKDPGEVTPAIAFTIALTGTDYMGGSVYATTTTDPSNNGYYEFTDIVPGTYVVSEMVPAGWTQSFPASSFYDVTTYSDVAVEMSYDFGNWTTSGLHGYKYEDKNANGIDDGEPGLEDWEIRIEGTTGWDAAFVATTTTDADGYWEFDEIPPGTYTISEVQQDGWTQSYPADPGTYEDLTLESGENPEESFDFLNWTTTGLHGYKYEDKNANGIDDGEPGLEDWEIRIEGTTGWDAAFVATTTTDADGYWEFDEIPPGTYTISEVQQDGWTQSYPADPGTYEDLTLESGDNPEESFDFLNWSPADPHGYKIHDLNANGVDDGEPRLEGWEIRVEGTTGWGGAYVATTTTDANGYWEFDEIPPGTYTITEVQQDGWTQSWPLNDGGHDMTLESGEIPEESFDFLNWTTATKFGMKFYDADGDGLEMEDGEFGLKDWTIFVDYNWNGVLDTDSELGLEPSGVTDADGLYTIDGIIPGYYPVREVNDDPDWMNTYPLMGAYYETFVSQGVYEDNDFGNTTKVDKTFELTFEAEAPADTTFTVTFSTEYVPRIIDQIPFDDAIVNSALLVGPESHELDLVETPAGSGVYKAALPVWPQTLITGVEWWAGYKGERIKLGDGVAEELIDAPMINEFEYDARAFGSKWNDTDLTVGTGDGIWDKATEPGIEGWTIQLYRKNLSGDWVLYDVAVTDADGAMRLPTCFLVSTTPQRSFRSIPAAGDPVGAVRRSCRRGRRSLRGGRRCRGRPHRLRQLRAVHAVHSRDSGDSRDSRDACQDNDDRAVPALHGWRSTTADRGHAHGCGSRCRSSSARQACSITKHRTNV